MKALEVLVLANNNLSNDDCLDEILAQLERLKRLDLSECNLSKIPSA